MDGWELNNSHLFLHLLCISQSSVLNPSSSQFEVVSVLSLMPQFSPASRKLPLGHCIDNVKQNRSKEEMTFLPWLLLHPNSIPLFDCPTYDVTLCSPSPPLSAYFFFKIICPKPVHFTCLQFIHKNRNCADLVPETPTVSGIQQPSNEWLSNALMNLASFLCLLSICLLSSVCAVCLHFSVHAPMCVCYRQFPSSDSFLFFIFFLMTNRILASYLKCLSQVPCSY